MKHNLKVKLNIKSIILYEKLTNSPFAEFSNQEYQVAALLYCMLVANNDYHFTFQDTIDVLFSDEKFLMEISKDLEKQLLCEQQFFNVYQSEPQEKTESNTEENIEKPFIYKLIPVLVKDCNLDIHYIMNDMHYSEIQEYMQYKEQSDKVDLVEKRLFTYLNMLPHITSKKVKSPSDILPFDWEIKEKKEKVKKEVEANQHKLREFLESAQEIKADDLK